jgi:hypothetical protein
MNITTAQVKEIRTEFAKLKPVKVTLDGNRSLTVKEAIFALAPILERMKKRGFDTQEIAQKLHEKGIAVKPPTLAKYLAEFRRQRERKPDRPALPKQEEKPQTDTVKPMEIRPEAARAQPPTPGTLVIRPDTPLDEL